MGFLTTLLPMSAAAKVAGNLAANLLSRRPDKTEQAGFQQVLQQTLGARTIAQRDSDGDGLLTVEEFPGGAEVFALWDANRDGKLSAAEIDAGANLSRQWAKLNSDNDDALTQHELGVTADVFRAIDTDHDLRVSRAEYYRAYLGGNGA